MRESSDEENAWVRREEQEGYKVPGHNVRARYVDVVGLGEGGTERQLALSSLPVKRGT